MDYNLINQFRLQPLANDLESLIRQYVTLGKPTAKGFETVKCAKCNDYKVRGGFKFEDGVIRYSCFNCSTKTVYDSNKLAGSISSNMKEVLLAFGIPESDIDRCVGLAFFLKKPPSEKKEPVNKVLEPPSVEIPFPEKTVAISTDDSPWCEVAREYLKGRGLTSNEIPFYVSDHEKWMGRVIIPYYFRGKVVYWQARSMDELIQPRYKNPQAANKDNIFFNMDEIYRYTNEPLFVTEGPLDSISIGKNAVALLGSSLNEFHIHELSKISSKRKIIFVIDKNLNGYKLGQRALKHEWYVTCFPDNVNDSNHALQLYGLLWLVNYVSSTAVCGFGGRTLLEIRCKR